MEHATRYRPSREYRTEPSEDSDIIVALFRSQVIIAFTAVSFAWGSYGTVVAPIIVGVAAVYTLALMVAFLLSRRLSTRVVRGGGATSPFVAGLLRRRLKIQRAMALCIDLALVTAVVVDTGDTRLLDLFYIVVVVGALWFHREGGVLSALAATACIGWFVVHADPPLLPAYTYIAPRGLICMVVGLVTGYLARAREGERRERERSDWELSIARSVQSGLLPEALPTVDGYDLGVRFAPARVVGGDYYDAVIAPDGRLFVTVADVAGKSVYAVMHLSLLRSHLRQAIEDGLPPARIAARLNRVLLAVLPDEGFISLACCFIDLDSGELCYTNCGHTPPLIVRTGTEGRRELVTGNIVLGIARDPGYDERTERLAPGECLVICTDGITEAMDAKWQPLDTPGVAAAVSQAEDATAQGVADAVLEAADRHAARAAPDDRTVLVVRRTPAQEA